MKTRADMVALLRVADNALGDPYQWNAESLAAFRHWLAQSEHWLDCAEQDIATQQVENGDLQEQVSVTSADLPPPDQKELPL